MQGEVVFVKLGGSLITDKRQEATPHPSLIRALAREMKEALDAQPHLHLLLGHGSGSFGHWEANRYHTQTGVETPEDWQGFARVGASAARLNRIVVDIFLEEGLPVISLQPSASALAADGRIETLALPPIRRALTSGLVPLVFGDVAFDRERGGTILSTENLFVYLAGHLRPGRILLVGNAPGVLDDQNRVIPTITPANYAGIRSFVRGSGHVDVTGGMADKVEKMMALVRTHPALRVWILTGRRPGNLRDALLDPDNTPGTCICAD